MTDPAPTDDGTTIVMLHYLGGSAREWDMVAAALGDAFTCLALDLAGFGDAGAIAGHTVEEMVDRVAVAIRARVAGCYLLVGHSMGAKVAMAVARHAQDGMVGSANPIGMVLLAGSPPEPEPMDEDRRADMLGWFTGDVDAARAEAERFVTANVASPLPAAAQERAIADLLRMDGSAWRAWLRRGSREDWSQDIGMLAIPTLVVAGADDGDLGPATQQTLAEAHFLDARVEIVADAAHLLPLEAPRTIARLIADHAHACLADGAALDPAYRALIGSDRVSARTRQVLLDRARPVAPDAETALSERARDTLEAVLDRVIPQRGTTRIDLAARIDHALATGPGDGWRFADLPPDAEAYAKALDMLADAGFADADDTTRDGILTRIAAGGFDAADAPLSPAQMALWFEDVRADAVRIYVAHPTTLARIGYSGVANGGDGVRKQGFERLAAGTHEPWEPLPHAETPA